MRIASLVSALLLPAVQQQRGSALRASADDGSEGAILRLQSLEGQLADAIASEDYAEAARLRDELGTLKMDRESGVLAANAEFYRAFQDRDARAMGALWHDAPDVACAHPGHAALFGHDAIMESWAQIFGEGGVHIMPKQVRVRVHSPTARVLCLEELRGGGGRCVAVNLFEQVGDRWRMTLHQAGPLMV